MTEAIVPAVTREDPRYYTMGKGGFVKRTGYAVSRLFITRTNSGKSTFNLSEIVGAGAAAGIGNAYYPAAIQPLGENVPTLGNAGGPGRRVQRIKRVLAGHRSRDISRKILIPLYRLLNSRFVSGHCFSDAANCSALIPGAGSLRARSIPESPRTAWPPRKR